MTQQIKWVGGIVNISPLFGKDFPHAFFEIDTDDLETHNYVLKQYEKFGIDVVSQRAGKGYHYFGHSVTRPIWREWYPTVKHLNPKYPPLTLRVTKKFKEEVWEQPVYHERMNVITNWAKALMHFLQKEHKSENSTNLHDAMNRVGLPKYFRCVVYKVDLSVNTNTLGY